MRDFGHYRRAVDLYRPGVGMHAFRYIANTRLRDVIQGYQQERHVACLLGHSQGGGEGGERYDKGARAEGCGGDAGAAEVDLQLDCHIVLGSSLAISAEN